MNLAEIYIEQQPNAKTYHDNNGLFKGTIFPALYVPYKYENKEISGKNKQENMLLALMKLDFAIIDMNLYLIMHDDDKEALKKMQEYVSEYRKILTYYENQYGPLSNKSPFIDLNKYGYLSSPWPWES